MVDDSVILNVCIIPDAATSADIEQISQSLASNDTLFTLGDGKFAHMTVYMARFPRAALPAVQAGLQTALASVQPLALKHAGYFLTAGSYAEVSYRKTDELLSLQDDIIAAVAGLRFSPGQPREEGYFTPYTAEQQTYARETGYDLAYDLYRPHVTLTRYVEGRAPAELPLLPATDLSFDLATIRLYIADDNGAVYEQITSFDIA